MSSNRGGRGRGAPSKGPQDGNRTNAPKNNPSNTNKPKQPAKQQQQPTRKQIEEQQKAIKEQNIQEVEQQIKEEEQKKAKNVVGINASVSHVRDPRTNTIQKIPDLSSHWVENSNTLLPFLPTNNEDDDHIVNNVLSSTQETVEVLNVDLSKLLKKKYSHFWSQVLYDPSFERFLDTYLRHRKRPYEYAKGQTVSTNQAALFNRVFRIIMRMSTHKESSTEYIDKEVYAKLIYEHHLFDIPKILDICVLYGAFNQDLLRKVVLTLFATQPKYLQDLQDLLPAIPKVISERSQFITKKANELPDADIIDTRFYFLDITATLSSFLVIYPEASHILLKHDILRSLIEVHEVVLPLLYQGAHLIHEMHQTKHFIQSVVNSLLQHTYFSVAMTPPHLVSGCKDCQKIKRDVAAEDLVQIITEMIHSENFLRDFGQRYSLQLRLWELKRIASEINIDVTRIDYIMTSLAAICGPFQAPKVPTSQAPSQKKVDTKLEQAISQVKELLPDLGDGFVQACLEAFNNNPERVINSILEDNLPGELAKMDRSTPRKEIAPEVAPEPAPTALETRRNVFDNDSFDIKSRDVIERDKIYIKSKHLDSNLQKMFSDKSDVLNLKSRYTDYEYEDEYDDSYDEFAGNYKISADKTKEEVEIELEQPQETEAESKEEESEEPEAESTPTQQTPGGGFIRGRGRGGSSPVHRGGRGGKTASSHRGKNHREQSFKKRTAFVTSGLQQ